MKASHAGFSFIENPPTVYYARRTLPLGRAQAILLIHLIKHESVSVTALLALGTKTRGSLRAQLSMIRKHLPPGVRLVNEYGEGYRLLFP